MATQYTAALPAEASKFHHLRGRYRTYRPEAEPNRRRLNEHLTISCHRDSPRPGNGSPVFFGYKFGTAIYDILRMSEAAVVFGETNLRLGKMASKAWWSGLRNEPAYRHFNPKQAAMAAIAFIIGAEVASSVDGEIAGNQGNRVRIGFLAWLAGGVGQAILDYGKLNGEHALAERFGRALLDLRSDIRAQVFGCREEQASAIS